MKPLVLAALVSLLCLGSTGCARRAQPAYSEPPPCPYDGASSPEPASPERPSDPGSQPVLVSPA